MDYIIFFASIQIPFLYIIWKMLNNKSFKQQQNLQILQKQHAHIANFMDTLRLSIEKISEDIYGKDGFVNKTNWKKAEQEIKNIQAKIHELEIYTGVSTESKPLESLIDSASLKDTRFR